MRTAACVLLFAAALITLTGCSLLDRDRRPIAIITRPPSGARVPAGETLDVQSTSTDDTGVVQVELFVNGALTHTDMPPNELPQRSFTVVQRVRPLEPGPVTIIVLAYDERGQKSEPAAIEIMVVEQPAIPAD